jgi:hypothetical protein
MDNVTDFRSIIDRKPLRSPLCGPPGGGEREAQADIKPLGPAPHSMS